MNISKQTDNLEATQSVCSPNGEQQVAQDPEVVVTSHNGRAGRKRKDTVDVEEDAQRKKTTAKERKVESTSSSDRDKAGASGVFKVPKPRIRNMGKIQSTRMKPSPMNQENRSIAGLQKQLEHLQKEKVAREAEYEAKRAELKRIFDDAQQQVELRLLQKRDQEMEDLADTLQCSICKELFIQATSLHCAHTFCKLCIAQWLRVKRECPVCRVTVRGQTRTSVLDSCIEKLVEQLREEQQRDRRDLLAVRKAEQDAFDELTASSSTDPSATAGTIPLRRQTATRTTNPASRRRPLHNLLLRFGRNRFSFINRFSGSGGVARVNRPDEAAPSLSGQNDATGERTATGSGQRGSLFGIGAVLGQPATNTNRLLMQPTARVSQRQGGASAGSESGHLSNQSESNVIPVIIGMGRSLVGRNNSTVRTTRLDNPLEPDADVVFEAGDTEPDITPGARTQAGSTPALASGHAVAAMPTPRTGGNVTSLLTQDMPNRNASAVVQSPRHPNRPNLQQGACTTKPSNGSGRSSHGQRNGLSIATTNTRHPNVNRDHPTELSTQGHPKAEASISTENFNTNRGIETVTGSDRRTASSFARSALPESQTQPNSILQQGQSCTLRGAGAKWLSLFHNYWNQSLG